MERPYKISLDEGDEEITWPCVLSVATKSVLLKHAEIQFLASDESIQIGKGPANGLFYVMSGTIVVSIKDLSKSCPFCFVKSGEWLCGSAIYNEPQFIYTAVSLDDSKLLFVPATVIRDAAESHPEIYKMLLFATQASKAIDLLFASTGMLFTQRVAFFLLEVLKRSPQVLGATPMISMSQTRLAKMLGASRLTLHQQLRTLEGLKIINVKRKSIYVRDVAALQVIAGVVAK